MSDQDKFARRTGPSYITLGGFRRIEEEIQYLREARAETRRNGYLRDGNLSKEEGYYLPPRSDDQLLARVREIDAQLDALRKLPERSTVIDPAVDRGNRIFFRATVTVEDCDSGRRDTFAIVGEHETDFRRRRISYLSPLGAALLKRKIGDEVVYFAPDGERLVTVLEIRYVALP